MISIEELAFKHLNTHPNDKSDRYLAKMNRRFGRKAANEALKKAKETLRLCDPDHPALKVIRYYDSTQFPFSFTEEEHQEIMTLYRKAYQMPFDYLGVPWLPSSSNTPSE